MDIPSSSHLSQGYSILIPALSGIFPSPCPIPPWNPWSHRHPHKADPAPGAEMIPKKSGFAAPALSELGTELDFPRPVLLFPCFAFQAGNLGQGVDSRAGPTPASPGGPMFNTLETSGGIK